MAYDGERADARALDQLETILRYVADELAGWHTRALKTEAELNLRARRIASLAWPVLVLLTIVSLVATISIRPEVLANYKNHPVGFLIPLLVFASLAAMIYFERSGAEKAAFASSALYIAGMLGGAAFALYPQVLPASTDARYSLTIYNTAAGHSGLTIGLIWWIPGMVLALAYFFVIYRMFRGKVKLEEGGEHGY